MLAVFIEIVKYLNLPETWNGGSLLPLTTTWLQFLPFKTYRHGHTWIKSCSKKQQSCASFPQLLDMMNTWHFSDCSGLEHKEGSVHHHSLSQYSCKYSSWWCICSKSVDFHGVTGRRVSFTLQLCPSCWSLVLQRWGTCSPLLPSLKCRWPNPEQWQATRWPVKRDENVYLIVIWCVFTAETFIFWSSVKLLRKECHSFFNSITIKKGKCVSKLNYSVRRSNKHTNKVNT